MCLLFLFSRHAEKRRHDELALAGFGRRNPHLEFKEPAGAVWQRLWHASASPKNTAGTSQSRPPTITNYNTSGFVMSWTGRDRARPLRLVVKSKRRLS